MSALTLRTRRHPTQTGHPDFPEAAAEARGPSVSFAATKLPFVTSRLRPTAAGRCFHNYPIERPLRLESCRTQGCCEAIWQQNTSWVGYWPRRIQTQAQA